MIFDAGPVSGVIGDMVIAPDQLGKASEATHHMDYFQPYPAEVQDVDIVGWESQIATAEREPSLRQLIAGRHDQLFQSFVTTYRALRRLPRGTRRALQRSFARWREAQCLINDNNSRGLAIGSLAQSLAGIALLVTLEQGQADAATINVTTNIPKFAADGRCSLPEAIVNANTDAAIFTDCASGNGSDTIVLPAKSTHQLQTILSSYYGGNGLPLITTAITIEGNGGRISRPKNEFHYRLMAVTNTGDLTLNNIQLSGGIEYYVGAVLNAGKLTIMATAVSGGLALGGGAVFNAPTGSLIITNSSLIKHTAVEGGAVFNFQGTVTIGDSAISGNRADNGGGVFSQAGTLEIDNSTITGNKVSDRGGGLFGNMAFVEIKNSTISKNSAYIAGGLLNDSGIFNVENSLITSNRAASSGGGIFTVNGEFAIDSSNISMNSAAIAAGVMSSSSTLTITTSGISNNRAGFKAGGLESIGNVTIDQTTISNNRAGDHGGGLNHIDGPLIINNSTISGNVAGFTGGGLLNTGNSQVSNSTITGNTAKNGDGGGIFNLSNQLSLERSLISGNKAKTNQEIFNRGPGQGGSGTVVSNDFNLIGTSNNAGIFGFTLGLTDIVPSGPIGSIIAPLADNGGPTPTHALVAGSPAINAIPSVLPECSDTDQRGVGRPQGAGCDIGAFEK